MELKLTSRDPVPALMKSVRNDHRKTRQRVAAVAVLGDIARRQDDQRAMAFLAETLSSGEEALREEAVKGLKDTGYRDALPALVQIRGAAGGDLRKHAEETLQSITRKMVTDIEAMWHSPETARAEYEEAEKAGAGRGLIGLSKARFLQIRGRYGESAARYKALGLIPRWWLLGTFPNRQGAGFATVFPPEKEIDLTKTYPSSVEEVRWYRMESDILRGFLDFESFFVEVDNVVGYAMTFVISDHEQPVEIRAGSDDTITIFLNGETIWSHEQYRGLAYDDDVVEATLREGPNILLFKVCEDWGDWALTARLTGPADTRLEGVRITLDPPDILPFQREEDE